MIRASLIWISITTSQAPQIHERDWWNGLWVFDQVYEVPQNSHLADSGDLQYLLKIKRRNSTYSISFEATSSLHATWIEAIGYQHGNQLRVVFQQYSRDGGSTISRFGIPMKRELKRGDLMFTLLREKDRIITKWCVLKPKSEDEFEPGYYFEFRGSAK